MITEKSIISPDALKPTVPIRKGTIAAMGGVLMLGVLVTSLVVQYGSSDVKPATAQKSTSPKPDAGAAAAIDDEKDKVDRQAKAVSMSGGSGTADYGSSEVNYGPREVRQSHDCANAKDPASPVPPCLRRESQDAAFGERAAAVARGQSSATQIPAAPSVGGSSHTDVAIEQDASARQSKALAFDAGESGSAAVPPSAFTAQFAPQAVGPNGPSRAPSAELQPGIDSALASLRNSGQQAKPQSTDRSWLNEYAHESDAGTKAHQTTTSYPTKSAYTLLQGKVIPAVIGRQVNSDLPGVVTAYTSVDVYDSLGNGYLLLPKGSALVGRYDSGVKIGQERLMFAFERVIMPNGVSFDLPSAEGSDLTGAAGATGDVNNHFFKMFFSSFFIAWVANTVQQPDITVNGGTTTSPAGQTLVDVSHTILDRNKNIQPTITLDQGTRINVEVAKDMEFAGPYNRSKN